MPRLRAPLEVFKLSRVGAVVGWLGQRVCPSLGVVLVGVLCSSTSLHCPALPE